MDGARIEAFYRLVEDNDRFSIAVHIRPDGDAVGSSLAMLGYLLSHGKDAVVLYPDTPPETLGFMFKGVDPSRVISNSCEADLERIRKRVAVSDVLMCLDCNNFTRIGAIEPFYAESKAKKVLIDHHLSPASECFDIVFSETQVSSACELLYNILLCASDVCGDAGRLPELVRYSLMTGMTTDTNNFANSVFPGTLTMASELLATGVNRDSIIAELFNRYNERRIRMMGYLLYENMRITPEGVAYMIVDKALKDKFEIAEGETEGFVNMPLAIDKVKMSIFLKEDGGFFRVSVRSKKGYSANICASTYFNGGGHELASGGRLFWPANIPDPSCADEYVRNVSKKMYGQEGGGE